MRGSSKAGQLAGQDCRSPCRYQAAQEGDSRGQLAGLQPTRQCRKVTAEGSWQPGAVPCTSVLQKTLPA